MFDLENHIFVIECLAHVLYNACKAGVMDVKSYGSRVDTEVNRRNMKRCINWTKKGGGKGFGDSAEACGTSL